MNNIIVCGSKGYTKLNLNNLIDNNFNNIIRSNLLQPGMNYGNKPNKIHGINTHIYNSLIKDNITKESFILKLGHDIDKNTLSNFYDYYHKNKDTINFIFLPNNFTDEAKIMLKQFNFKIKKQLRCGHGIMMNLIFNNKYPFVIGYSVDNVVKSSYNKKNPSDCHNMENEIELLKLLHNHFLIDATFSLLKDRCLPTLSCSLLKPKEESIIYILNTYGICILDDYYSQETVDILMKEYHKIFEEQKSKIEILDKEDCSNDERIFHAQKYSEYIKNNFSDNNLFNNIAQKYTNKRLNKKTLINKVVYEDGKIKNSGAGWHRDNHNCQFKVIMYLSDVNEKNGPFQFMTNSSKKHIGYPPPRTANYNTRFHDKTVEELVEKNKNCNIHNIVGKKGTIVIVDTTYIHRGKIIEEGERYAMTEYFL